MVLRILAVVAVLFAFTAAPAHAGGPTSVLLSAPPSVAAFGYDDPEYDQLQTLTEPAAGETRGQHSIGRFVRATWLIHDMSVWRIDIIYPDAPGGPWILSENTLRGAGPITPTWHQVANPAKLKQLLSDLKLLDGEFYGGPTLGDGYSLEQPMPTPVAEPQQQPPTQQPRTQVWTTTSVFTGWRWIIPGVLVGAGAALLAVRLFPRRRWELID